MTPRASAELLSIFFPMWNEEAYVERAIAAATASASGWSPTA